MNEEERRLFESLENLRRAAFERFDSRRSYEWKLSLAIWAAEGLIIVAVLQPLNTGEVFPLKTFWGVRGAAILAVALVVLHSYLSACFKTANKQDRRQADDFENAMRGLLNLGDAPENRPWWHFKGWWSHAGQVLITALLAGAAVLIIHIRP